MIRDIRKDKVLLIEEIAAKTGISVSTLGKVFFFPCLSKVMDGMYNIVTNPEIFILETA